MLTVKKKIQSHIQNCLIRNIKPAQINKRYTNRTKQNETTQDKTRQDKKTVLVTHWNVYLKICLHARSNEPIASSTFNITKKTNDESNNEQDENRCWRRTLEEIGWFNSTSADRDRSVLPPFVAFSLRWFFFFIFVQQNLENKIESTSIAVIGYTMYRSH